MISIDNTNLIDPEKHYGGDTRRSLQHIKNYKDKLGAIREVQIHYNDWGTEFSYFIGTDATLLTTGFSIGYDGEGPRGLIEALEEVNVLDPSIDHGVISEILSYRDVRNELMPSGVVVITPGNINFTEGK